MTTLAESLISSTSRPLNPQYSTKVRALDSKLRWVTMAPLGGPVVPEV
jgi:hypothetical protein